MTDLHTFPPALQITANYPATDGTSPEHITVEIALNCGVTIDDVLIDHIVKSLTDVPARARYTAAFEHRQTRRADTPLAAEAHA